MDDACFCTSYASLKVDIFVQFQALLFTRKYGHLWWSILWHFRMTMNVDICSLEGPYKNSLDELWTLLAFAYQMQAQTVH